MRRTRPKTAPAGASAGAVEALGPYARTRLMVRALGIELRLDVPADVFAARAIDEGTLLLLRNLPVRPPQSFLDVGCGYGALGLPVAARFPQARAVLIDRDLLAVRAAAHNARALGLGNVEARPGLGYRDLPDGERFDLVLCNVPARIGSRGVAYLLEAGRSLLTPGGELRAVVIRDLRDQVEAAQLDGARLAASGKNHLVYSVAPGPSRFALQDESVYARDETRIEAAPERVLVLSRPHDASEDPGHAKALAALLDAAPRSGPRTALSFRCGYGALPLAARIRWPQAQIVAQDRDLLETAFLRRNAASLGLLGDRLRVLEAVFPSEALPEGGAGLVLGEASAPAGEAVFARELLEARRLLAPGGEALVLASEKQAREWLPAAAPSGASVLLRREGACVLRIARPKGA
ncbi:MAG: methyltransferase [Myxococcales bacterium]